MQGKKYFLPPHPAVKAPIRETTVYPGIANLTPKTSHFWLVFSIEIPASIDKVYHMW